MEKEYGVVNGCLPHLATGEIFPAGSILLAFPVTFSHGKKPGDQPNTHQINKIGLRPGRSTRWSGICSIQMLMKTWIRYAARKIVLSSFLMGGVGRVGKILLDHGPDERGR